MHTLVTLVNVTLQRLMSEHVFFQQKKNKDIFDLRITENLLSN